MNEQLNELERLYREEWTGFSPSRCREFIASIATPADAKDLLVRLLCVDLELSRAQTQQSNVSQLDDDDARVAPCVELLRIQFPELNDDPLGLERLIVLEFALRTQHEEDSPNIDSYIANCPSARLLRNLEEAQARLHEIRYATPETSITNLNVSKSKTTVPQSSELSTLVAPRVPFTLGRFLLIRYIGRGGMGFVYDAIDLSSTAQVAVKMMRRGDGWSIYRFIEEFRWLSQLNHPNLVRLYAAFTEGEARYFSMEYVQGTNIRDWYGTVLQRSSDPIFDLTNSLGQLASAIHFLHSQGVIHRDIKHSNVMITPRGRTVLLDLGLAIRQSDQHYDEAPSSGEAMPGTLAYMAPEAHNSLQLTPASDWYSFGVTMFELLTGDLPISKVTTDASGARVFALDIPSSKNKLEFVPAKLAELCLKLLEPDPSRRPRGQEVLDTLEFNCVRPNSCEFSLSCVGREIELAILDRTKTNCLTIPYTSQVVLVCGEPGLGKSMLLQTWLASCQEEDWFVFSIKNYRQDNTPHRLMNALVQELVRLWGAHSQLLTSVFLPFENEIRSSFPQFENVLWANGSPPDTRSQNPNLADRSIQKLLLAIAKLSQIKPVIIAVDDVQWADPSGLAYLCNYLLKHAHFRGIVLLTTDSFGKPKVETAIGDLSSVVQLSLGPLSQEVCQILLMDWIQQSNKSLSQTEIHRLISLSKGSPFLLRELFRSFLDQQISSGDYVATDMTVGRLVTRRFSRMPRPAEVVLQYLAISERPLLLQQLLFTSRMTPLEMQTCLSLLSHQGWVRIWNETLDTAVELASESFRDAVIDTMTADKIERRHFRLARALSAEIDPPWSRAAMHYEKSTKHRLAAACHIQAAQDAFRSGAFREALSFIEKGLHPEANRSESEQLKAELMQVSCHSSLGDSTRALQLLEVLLDQSDPVLQAEVRTLTAGQMFRLGRLQEGLEMLTPSLQQSQVVVGSRTFVRLRNSMSAFKIAYRPVPVLRTDEPEFGYFEPRSKDGPLLEAHTNLVGPLWFLDPDQAIAIVARFSAQVDDPTLGVAVRCQLMLWKIVLLTQFGRRYSDAASQRLKLGIRVVRRLKGLDAQSCLLAVVVACLSLGKFPLARRYARRSVELFGMNQSWERQFLVWAEQNLLWFSGQLPKLLNTTNQKITTSQSIGQNAIAFISNSLPAVVSALIRDNLVDAKNTVARSQALGENEKLMQPQVYQRLSELVINLYQNDHSAASLTIEEDWRHLVQSSLLNMASAAVWAYSQRINLAMLRLRSDPASRVLTRELSFWIGQLKQVDAPPIVCLAEAYDLVFDAGYSCRLEPALWHRVRRRLNQSGLGLYAMALHWHESTYAGESSADRDRQCYQVFEQLGCKAPRQLMNIILPLPINYA